MYKLNTIVSAFATLGIAGIVVPVVISAAVPTIGTLIASGVIVATTFWVFLKKLKKYTDTCIQDFKEDGVVNDPVRDSNYRNSMVKLWLITISAGAVVIAVFVPSVIASATAAIVAAVLAGIAWFVPTIPEDEVAEE